MPRSQNAQIAIDLYEELDRAHLWNAGNAWQGIARLLLTTRIWISGTGWRPFHDVIVYRESNDFNLGANGAPNAVLRRAESLTLYLAAQLGVSRSEISDHIGIYWNQPVIADLQPHNLVGHAFRSLVVTILGKYGDSAITYEEEADPRAEFPGYQFQTRSKDPKLDIVARREGRLVALLSTRWRYRHDRVDLVDEAIAYAPPARRQNRHCQLYAVIGEFAPNRLDKVLSNCPPASPNAALSAAVHFAPQLLWEGLGENGRTSCLQSLEWLVQQTWDWR
jgi:hypothetical protein